MTRKPIRVAVKAVVVQDGRLLLIKKLDADGEFFIFPGGGQEYGEPMEHALVREVQEETGLAVEPGDIFCVRDYIGANHEFRDDSHQVELYFAAKLLEAGHSSPSQPDEGQVGVEWVPLREVENRRIYPQSMRKVFAEQRTARIYLGDVN